MTVLSYMFKIKNWGFKKLLFIMWDTQKDFDLNHVIPSDARMVTVAWLAWGDEGKGKVAASLDGWYYMVAAANGGGNAGHNVIVHEGTKDEKKLHFHELPWASVAWVSTYISGGRVVNISKLCEEIGQLQAHTSTQVDIILSVNSQVIISSLQQKLDSEIEWNIVSNGGKNVGTTKKWIWPAYWLKALRVWLSAGQLLYGDTEYIRRKVASIVHIFSSLDSESIIEEYILEREKLKSLISQGIIRIDETNTFVSDTLSLSWKNIVVECSQSVMLSLSGNAYPNCTSSECGFNGIAPSLWVEWPWFKIGVIKAIPSKVGNGIFPTRFDDNHMDTSFIEAYRSKAGEFWATTGRPRDIWFLDAVQLRYVFKNGNRPDILWINMVDLLSFLYRHWIRNKAAVWYIARHNHTQEVYTFTDIVPPGQFTIQEVLYQDLPDVTSENDYQWYIDVVRKLLWFEWPIVIWVWPWSNDNMLFE